MSHPKPTSPPLGLPKPPPLHTQKSLSNGFYREELWLRQKNNRHHQLHRRTKSLITIEDIDELKGCVDLGFHFTSESTNLSKTFPALDLYYATSSPPTPSSNSSPQQSCSPHAANTAATLFNSGENPEMVKTRLKQWAKVVACAARQPASCCKEELKD